MGINFCSDRGKAENNIIKRFQVILNLDAKGSAAKDKKTFGISVVCVHNVFFLEYHGTKLMIYTAKFVNLV